MLEFTCVAPVTNILSDEHGRNNDRNDIPYGDDKAQ